MTQTTEFRTSGRVIVTDWERRNDYWKWKAFQESDWAYFGVPEGASVRLSRLEDDQATAVEWQAEPKDELRMAA